MQRNSNKKQKYFIFYCFRTLASKKTENEVKKKSFNDEKAESCLANKSYKKELETDGFRFQAEGEEPVIPQLPEVADLCQQYQCYRLYSDL